MSKFVELPDGTRVTTRAAKPWVSLAYLGEYRDCTTGQVYRREGWKIIGYHSRADLAQRRAREYTTGQIAQVRG